ncbi:OLC1v1034499C1 [Oldenlandia corymbosa var. corymbosa]|uniref:acylphosphatase n=1 Tax=Oldenlandia corymbosa var. corymbosa TaxID=529605 RepID=A0AAV1CRF9_OLDCO|nr:OLC1v1034499C1 [Oldenlandia corymbosa var. corymbosa]
MALTTSTTSLRWQIHHQVQQHCCSIHCESLYIRENHQALTAVEQFLWPRRRKHDCASLQQRSRTRSTRSPLLLLPSILPPCPRSLPIPHRFLLPPPPFRPLRRPRSPPRLFPMSSLANSDSNASSSPPATKTERVVIKGRVQGVFYRDWTVQNATELGLKGWVRNRRDGSVEALFSGPAEKVQEMEQRCRSGPPSAIVTGFQAFPCNDDPGTGFERRQTV